jgi:hypothetical protein
LPSSLTEGPSSTSGSSPCPPVSGCGTVARALTSGFSGPLRPGPLGRDHSPASPSLLGHRPGAFPPPASLPASTAPVAAGPAARGPRFAQPGARRTGLTTRMPSPTAPALGLGPPHPQRISRAAEPLGIRWGGFAPPSRYSYRHSHSPPLHHAFQRGFAADGDAPLPRPPPQERPAAASVGGLRPANCRRRSASTSELLRTLSRMAASKPTSWLSARPDLLGH